MSKNNIYNLDFVAELDIISGIFNTLDYPFSKQVRDGKDRIIRFYGRRDLPDVIYNIKRIKDNILNIYIRLENRTANTIIVNKVKLLKLFEDGKGIIGSIKPDIWLWRFGTISPGDDVRFVPLFGEYKFDKGNWSTKDWYKICNLHKEIFSESFGIFKNLETNISLLLGFISMSRQECKINILVYKDYLVIEPTVYLNEYYLSPGCSVSTEILQVAINKNARELFINYIDAVKDYMNPKFCSKIPTGWSSWQYYRRNITEQDILENVKAIKKDKYPIEYILLDDGYQLNMSDWLKPNKKFPHGIKWLAKKIREAGYIPGLWIAPLTAHESSEFFKNHKNWFVRDKEGNLLKKYSHMGNIYVIDYTIEGACKWLASFIKTLVRDYGFKYLKLDGPILRYYSGGVFSKRNVTPVEVIRKTLKIIRENSKGALIEGEGYYGPSIGLVDVQRTAQDIQTDWSKLKNNLQVNLMSNFFHKKWWINNPDAFILRDTPTPNHYDPKSVEHILTKDELQTEITAHILSGGEVMLTDRMDILKEERKELTKIFLPPVGKAAEPVDIFNGEDCPNIFKLVNGREIWIAVFNWGEKKRDFCIDLKLLNLKKKKYIVKDYWNNKDITVSNKINLKHLNPHSVKLLIFKL
jgi:alpha-galactosidase